MHKMKSFLFIQLITLVFVTTCSIHGAEIQKSSRHSKKTNLTANPISVNSSSSSLARYLPQDEILFVQVENLKSILDMAESAAKSDVVQKKLKTIPNNPLNDFLTNPDAILNGLGLPDKATLGDVKIAFGVRVVMPRFTPSKRTRSVADPEPQLIALIEAPTVDAATKIKTSITKLVDKTSPIKPKISRLGKYELVTYPQKDINETVAYTQMDKLLAVGQLSAVRYLISTSKNPKFQSLATSADFQTVCNKLETPAMMLSYLNTKTIGDLVIGGAKIYLTMQEPSVDAKTRATKKLKSVNTKENIGNFILAHLAEYLGLPSTGGIGIAINIEEKKLTERFFMSVNRHGKGLIPIIADAPDVSLQAANIIPDSTHIFTAHGLNHLRLYDEALEAIRAIPHSEDSNKPEQAIKFVEETIGIKIRDEALSSFTGEHGVVINFGEDLRKIIEKGKPKGVKGVFYAVVKNPELLKTLLKKLITVADSSLSEKELKSKQLTKPVVENYKDIDIWKLGNGPAKGAFLNDVFIVGKNIDDVKWVIDSFMSGQVLAKNEGFQTLKKNLPNNAMASFYTSESFFKAIVNALSNVPEVKEFLTNSVKYKPIMKHIQHDDSGIYMNYTYER